ncbi:DUF1223 domain-containing protein [Mariluticola halotolerans]|uniref:DUF1223 domain-containing protein n=1 Tax=Mariluticola halotolerans TaxID=2909283 RepID=UPI0026E37A76|nr:DUF1223 domain-containing protein [Mariluticola halotolerans]UJQ93596.1 DUF1223 domain-containing protein [Mariluticola halotolerans]
MNQIFRPVFVLSVLAGLLPGSAAQTAEVKLHPVAVLELFTSQGCSSCPAADKLLSAYDARDDVIALAYHVDYWDYIGWRDVFGSADNSDYQRAYAKAQRQTRIYTPQLMVNGTQDVVGSRSTEVKAAVAAADLPVPVTLSANADMLDVRIDADAQQKESVIWLVKFRDRAEVEIERGELAGRAFDYTQIVTGRQVLGMWEPETGAHVKLPLSEVIGADNDGAVILVQEEAGGLPGRIIGAASFKR